MSIIQTKQLQLRPYVASDFHHIFRLHSDPEVMHYIREAISDPEIVRERTEMWLKYADENPGFGVLTIELIENQSFVGYAVVRHVEFQPGKEIEIGYALDKICWGKGYASEAAQALVQYADDALGEKKLVAYTDENNLASNRVLEKCGFQRIGHERVYNADCLRWEK